jgi:hypothetical protein
MRSARFVSALLFGIALLAHAGPSAAVGKCKVKVDKKTGAILVSASDVTNNPLWSGDPASIVNGFADIADCFSGGKLKSCRIGAPGSLAEIQPPAACAIHLTDDSAETCAARVPGCTPGVRNPTDGLTIDSSSDQELLFVRNNGAGEAIYASAAGGSSAIRASQFGDNDSVANFQIQNAANIRAAIFARTDGLGYAGQFEVNSDTSATALFVRTTSNDPGSLAAAFVGDVDVSGTLTKDAGAFRIDHPLDPENRYLQHSFVESPDMMNVYNGNVALGPDGAATVELPAWFEALNRDFRYQLTPIGGPGPNLHVAREIEANRFSIAGGTPGLRVSWQVTGVRHDAYADAHRIEVELAKTDTKAQQVSRAETPPAAP